MCLPGGQRCLRLRCGILTCWCGRTFRSLSNWCRHPMLAFRQEHGFHNPKSRAIWSFFPWLRKIICGRPWSILQGKAGFGWRRFGNRMMHLASPLRARNLFPGKHGGGFGVIRSGSRDKAGWEKAFSHPADLYWDQFPHLSYDLARRLPHTFSLLVRKQ